MGGGGDFRRSEETFLDNDGEIVPACRSVPVVDIRTSICGVGVGLKLVPGDDIDRAAGRVWNCVCGLD